MKLDAAKECFDNCLSAALGHSNWKERNKVSLVRDIATVSDEAFCLVTLDDNCNQWLDILCEPGLTKEERNLWATPLCTNKKKSNGKRGEGWDVEGLDVFEEHFEKMEEVRDV